MGPCLSVARFTYSITLLAAGKVPRSRPHCGCLDTKMNVLSGHLSALGMPVSLISLASSATDQQHTSKQRPASYDGFFEKKAKQKGFVWKYSRTYRKVTRLGQSSPVCCMFFVKLLTFATLASSFLLFLCLCLTPYICVHICMFFVF